MLCAANLDGVLLNAQHNFAWLTGGKSNAINASVENGAGYLFVGRDGKKVVFANNIELDRLLNEELSAGEFEPVEFSWQDEKSSSAFIFEKAQSLMSANGEIASDLPLNSNYRAIENLIAPCRYSLTWEEIERYRTLGGDAGEVLGGIFERIAPGATEREIAGKVKNALAVRGIDSVVTLVGADERIEQYRHPVPTEKIWRKTLLIAVCAKRAGLIANVSRLANVGEISGELERKTIAAAKVFAELSAATGVGRSGAELYRTAAAAYAESGFGDEIHRHHQGGATGYKTRDWTAHPKSSEQVVVNQAFAWNPSITGTKIEETFILMENGAETLTASPSFPPIVVEINGREYLSSGILSL